MISSSAFKGDDVRRIIEVGAIERLLVFGKSLYDTPHLPHSLSLELEESSARCGQSLGGLELGVSLVEFPEDRVQEGLELGLVGLDDVLMVLTVKIFLPW